MFENSVKIYLRLRRTKEPAPLPCALHSKLGCLLFSIGILQRRELVFQGTISEDKHWQKVFMAGTEYFGATAQPRDHIPEFYLSTNPETTQSHTFAAVINLSATPHNPFSRFIWAKYHQITRKHSAYWQINTSRLFSHTRLFQVPGCTVTRSADQHIPFCPGQSSPAILLSPNRFDS